MIRRVIWGLLLLLGIGVAARSLPLDFLRPGIERVLARGLGRKVEIGGAVHLNLFGAPGFTLEDVTIHEDPRAGIEPFAYVSSLNAGVRWLSVLRRRWEFSNLNLGNAHVNLVKTDAGPWNFQFLLEEAARDDRTMPAIRIRNGRVNFKFGDTKSVFVFDRADFDVSPYGNGAVELRFGGAPSRTDGAAREFGYFFVRGNWNPSAGPRLDLSVELERSSLDDVSRVIDPRGFGLQGSIALQAQISGPPERMLVNGQMQTGDMRRLNLLSQRSVWTTPFKGSLDLRTEKLDLASADDPSTAPLSLQFRAWDFLSAPRWEAGAHLNLIPLGALLEVARHMGAAFPEELAAEGGVSGELAYTHAAGLTGRVELRDASLTLPDGEPLRASSAPVTINNGTLYLEASTVDIGAKQSAEMEGTYTLNAPRELDLRIATRGLNVADMHSFGLAAIPLLDRIRQGVWRGWARFRAGQWSGEYELQNARISVDGVADPVRIQSALVKLNGAGVAISRLRAKAGEIAFTGEYRWEPAALRPHRFALSIEEADAAELERLFAPALVRQQGFLARTLGLAPAPAPAWLAGRRAEGTVSIGTLAAGDLFVHLQQARLLWDSETVRLAGVEGTVGDAAASGEIEIALDGRSPHYRFNGKLQDVSYKGGKLDFEGTLDADGGSDQILESARAVGEVRGRSISFAPEADFRSAVACFEMQGARWKLSTVEVTQGAETLAGTGATQADGRLVLELARGGRQMRYLGTLFAGVP